MAYKCESARYEKEYHKVREAVAFKGLSLEEKTSSKTEGVLAVS